MLHSQGSSQLGTVFSWGLLLKVPAFMRVKHRDFSDEIRSFLISPTALLCLLIRSECIFCWLHFSSTCSQVSGSFELHMGHVIEGYLWCPKNICFLALPMYVPVRNLIRHDFCLSVIKGFVQNSLDSSLSMSIFSVHLHVLGVCAAMTAILVSLSYFLICFSKNLTGPLSGTSSIEAQTSF